MKPSIKKFLLGYVYFVTTFKFWRNYILDTYSCTKFKRRMLFKMLNHKLNVSPVVNNFTELVQSLVFHR